MELYALYTSNAAMEIVMLVILSFLLVNCSQQKQQFSTIRPLMHLTFVNMLMLICQIIEWYVTRSELVSAVTHIMIWRRITYSLDYALYYAMSVCFYCYISTYISELCADKGIGNRNQNRDVQFLIGWGIVISTMYLLMIHNQGFYYLDTAGKERFHKNLYLVMYLLSTVGMISSCNLLIKNFKLLKGSGFWLLLSYVVLPFMTLLPDLINSRCISYLLMSFFVFILYIEIDLKRGALIQKQAAQLASKEAQMTELQTKIILSQMQPHFLYNTFSTISALCYLEDAPEAKEVVDKFSDYFRQNLDALGKDNFIPFQKELEHVRTYLWIEKVRFEDALTVEYRIETDDFLVPSLTLQPLVENAVKHGIRGKIGGGTVIIETHETLKEYVVTIWDNGAGFDPTEEPDNGKTHIGIENISNRLRILHAGYLEVESVKGQGTIASVHLLKERSIV